MGLRFFKNMYSSGKVKGREENIRMKLESGAGMVGVYCIALPLYGSFPLEIYNAAVLKQRWFRRSDLLIVGLADSLINAEILSSEILSDVKKARGDYNSRCFFTEGDGGDMLPDIQNGEEEI